MPRTPRKKSAFGYMHIICRGNGRQVLFEEDFDYRHYLKLLQRFSRECEITVAAYCLMENHVHLLVKDSGDQIASFMKKTGIGYSEYFNRKYERSGHLFQGRYMSEAVEDEKYLLTVFRYILNNPQKAGICPASRYKWSSYRYLYKTDSFIDASLLFTILGSRKSCFAFLESDNDDNCLEYDGPKKDDIWARAVIARCLDGKSGTFLQSLCKKDRNHYIQILKHEGLSVRQIERLTGISRNIVQRA